jgi:hypothetical protein
MISFLSTADIIGLSTYVLSVAKACIAILLLLYNINAA